MNHPIRKLAAAAIATAAFLASLAAHGHGPVTPQGVDTTGLPALGDKWRDQNPFSTNKQALKVGTSAYNQNCARCHGIDAVSGGIAPDLRHLDRDCVGMKVEAKKQACFKEMDNYYLASVRTGKVRNGAVYMPPFEGVFNQEAMWAIKTYLETRRETK
ncbi:cytochrome c-550 PedF [Massilia cavernae]|uniref:Cytochrome c-550 PedF n=1 Tax=Massilia cavernae TaxID=2320864 RepID=A0A418XF54_9BURK|nr:cytochrome c-550 PedF [Massilia cavernae]RJG11166.1 cytochrome c-550 PedF [Massilia cavernae]